MVGVTKSRKFTVEIEKECSGECHTAPDGAVDEAKYTCEVKWMHKSIESNTWVERDILFAVGYLKIVMKKDEQEAAAAGLLSKPLTQQGVEKALKDLGLNAETTGSGRLREESHIVDDKMEAKDASGHE